MKEHRWHIPCTLDPDEAEMALGPLLEALAGEGWTVFEQAHPSGFFGWTLRHGEHAAGVVVPQPGGPATLIVRAEDRATGERVVAALTSEGPLAGERVRHEKDEATGPA